MRAAGILPALAVSIGLATSAAARDWPPPRGHLNDFAGIVDAAAGDSIEALARELRHRTGAELAVVTVQSLEGEEIEPAAVELFQAWGIGGKKRDDGVLILLAENDRRVRIEVGYGLEGLLPDGRCGSIIRRVMGPDLSADRFGTGLLRGAEAVAGVIAEAHGITLERRGRGQAPPLEEPRSAAADTAATVLVVILAIILIAAYASQRRAMRRGGWGGWGGFGGFGGGWSGMGGGFGGFGGGGGGGGGGGFGGFGGGSSGGGGASGRF